MTVSNNAYSLLADKLQQIENTAMDGGLYVDSRECCLAIRALVYQARQIMQNEFYVAASDDLPPAA
ncbi:MAG: hypothetical protein ACFNX1_00685 [Treponema lecithinolyticum]|uniref:hypothetical protein n=1 Tax=Treponema lecithinolyticum TaxID=53418 RepID=UPI00360A8C6E